MRGKPLALALPAVAVLLALVASPAAAVTGPTTQPTYPTTPVPSTQPGEPPASSPNAVQPTGRAVGDAATGLAVVRLLPGAVPTSSVLPGAAADLPKQSGAEAGFGLSSAQANSEAFLTYEHAVAQSCPAGVAVEGNSPQLPGCLSQTASPDNAAGLAGGLNPPATPLDPLLKVGVLTGTAHARWSDATGPCVGTISDASTSLASISAVNVLPSLPTTLDANALAKAMSTANLPAATEQSLIGSLSQMTGPLSNLAGLLSGAGTGTGGSLVSVPNLAGSRSTVRLVDIPGSANKAVQSVSTMQLTSVRLLAGTPLETDLNVVSRPTLTATSTGDPKTSTVGYTAPVIQIVQAGKVVFTLDAAHPTTDLPIGIPLNVPNLPKLPVIGSLLPNGQPLTSNIPVVDIGVLRLSVAELTQNSQALTAGQNGAPFTGQQIGGTARLLDLQVLPTQALGIPNLPAALVQVSLGEQSARAYAPTGGVTCGSTTAAAGSPPPAAGTPKTLAWTGAAYESIPLFWTGTALLLAGVIMVAALPRPGIALATGPRPTPKPAPEPKPEPAAEKDSTEPDDGEE